MLLQILMYNLRQRHDLVPQLVETVKGYASHEKDLLLKVTEARTAAMAATSIDDKIKAEQQLTAALQGLKVQVEAYPDLKANQNFLQLQEELSDIENKLAASRRFFNGATTEYNNAVESFPGNLIAGILVFKEKYFLTLVKIIAGEWKNLLRSILEIPKPPVGGE